MYFVVIITRKPGEVRESFIFPEVGAGRTILKALLSEGRLVLIISYSEGDK